jgi:hypothetical protein
VNVLDEILEGVRADLAARQQLVPLDELKQRSPGSAIPSMRLQPCAGTAFGSSPR